LRRQWAALATVVMACCVAHAQPALVAGGARAMWLVRLDQRQNTFDALVRPLGKDWELSAREIVGRPAAVATFGERLAVLFEDGQYHIFSQDADLNQPGENLPVRPLAAWGDGDDEAAYVLVIGLAAAEALARPGGQTQPAAQNSTQATHTAPGASAAGQPALVLLQSDGLGWRLLAPLPELPLADRPRVLLAGLDDNVYVLLPGIGRDPNRLLRWDGSQWHPAPLSPELAQAAIRQLLAIHQQLVMLVEQPQADRTALAVVTLDAQGNPVGRQGLTLNGQPVDWPADRLPQAARLGDQLALVWPGQQDYLFATASARTGQLLAPPQQVPVRRPSQLKAFQTLLNYFLMGVLAAIFVAMFLLRPQIPPKPFRLPPHVRPGGLLRRLLAALLDFLPFLVLGELIFQPPAPPVSGSLERMFREYLEAADARTAYAAMFTLAGFGLYGAAAEFLRGATLGKWIFRLRVVGDEAAPPTLRQVALRNLLKILELLTVLLVLLVVMPLLSRYRQRAGDWFARTAVVDAGSLAQPPSDAGSAQAGGMGDDWRR